jgi:hypothetical protein
VNIAFIACIEPGRLESQTLLLCESLRAFGGSLAGAPIHTWQPRCGPALPAATLQALEGLGVAHHVEPLNSRFHDYPIGNKIFVSARAEEVLEAEVIVFVDSDTVFLNEPEALRLPAGVAVAARPVDHRNRGSSGPDDPNEPYWVRVHEVAGLPAPAPDGPYIETAVGRERVRPYFNAGLIAARREAGVFRAWRDMFLALMRAGHVPGVSAGAPIPTANSGGGGRGGQMTFMDQIALAAVVAKRPAALRLLDWRYNYPLPKRPLLPPPQAEAPLESLIHVHYHRWFNRPGFLDELTPRLDPSSAIVRWLSERLPLRPVIDEPLRFAAGCGGP